MSQFKVLEEVEIDGATHAVDAVVELDEAVAAPLVESGKLEAVASDAAPAAGQDTGRDDSAAAGE